MRLRFADIVTINCPTPRSAPMRKTITSVLLAAGMAAASAGLPKTASAQPIVVTPIPAQVPAKEGFADIPDTRLWYWDTGGSIHPAERLGPDAGGISRAWALLSRRQSGGHKGLDGARAQGGDWL